jgi:uncharacterized membrane protein
MIREFVPDSVSVFVPTTPNPTTGFLVMVPRDKVVELSITIDQAFTMILSGGAVAPDAVAAAAPSADGAPTAVAPAREASGTR